MRRQEGYLTVYLTLCLTLILSIYLGMIEAARRNGGKLEAACASEIGLQSILAEYHRELFHRYNMFAIDSSYGSEISGRRNTEAHLLYYINNNLHVDNSAFTGGLVKDFFELSAEDAALSGVSVLTDWNGAVFRECAIETVKEDYGLGFLESIKDWMRVIEINGLEGMDVESQKRQMVSNLESYNGMEMQISEEESVKVEVENPSGYLDSKINKGILPMVIKDTDTISGKRVGVENLYTGRYASGCISSGNMTANSADDFVNRFLFQEYLLKYMSHYGENNKEGALEYQIEYLLAGKDSDVENLKSVVNRLLAIREAANVLYLYSDREKRAEITIMAAAICGIFSIPGLLQVVEGIILLSWASAESLYDIKTLLAGGRIPLIKNAASWHYSLENAIYGETTDWGAEGQGLSYEDYLRVLMMLTNLDTLTGRAMNMIEADIRRTPGNNFFRLDACYVKVEAEIRIKSSYGYEYKILRSGAY